MIQDKCMKCEDIVPRWTLTEVFIKKDNSHYDVCNDCKKKCV